jgi:hypothetical protein
MLPILESKKLEAFMSPKERRPAIDKMTETLYRLDE